MKNIVIRITILTLLFIVSVIGMSFFADRGNDDLTITMKEASLPLVSLSTEKYAINRMYGYQEKMDARYMRDTIAPLGDSREMDITIKTYGTVIDAISYEIRSLDTTRLVEDTKVNTYTQEGETIQTTVKFKNLMEKNEEYILTIKLEIKGKIVNYYSRIVQSGDKDTDAMIEFVKFFHNSTFDDESVKELALYLESNVAGNNSSLNKVDIYSSLSQVAWGDLEVTVLEEPIPSVHEINKSYNTITQNYTITALNEQGETQYYNVREYYRIRKTDTRMYLVDFERTMDQIFNVDNQLFYDQFIQLGIRSESATFVGTENGNIVAFVQEGELWEYNQTLNKLSKVYSFRSGEGIDTRENYGEHDIQIIRINEMGSIEFLVYGYMNRGIHEGTCGVGVFYYDSIANTVEEQLFLESDKPYQMMKQQLGKLFYMTDENMFYSLVDGKLYRVDLVTLESEILVEDIEEGCYAMSENGRMFAWQEEGLHKGKKIKVLDLETNASYEIQATAEENIKPLGFSDTDFIYGTAFDTDIVLDVVGNITFPMYRVTILNEKKEVIKEYQKEGFYVLGVTVQQDTIYLERAIKEGVGYKPISNDSIMNNTLIEEDAIKLHSTVTKLKQTEYQIQMLEVIQDTTPQILTPKEILFKKSRNIKLDSEEVDESYYFVYGKGQLLEITKDINEAISFADENAGVVISEMQNYAWERVKKKTTQKIDVIPNGLKEMIDKNEMSIVTLEAKVVEEKILNLSGCTMQNVLYYVSIGNPVLGLKPDGTAVLIVGYDERNVILLDNSISESYKMGLKDSEEMFREAGNYFVGYMK